MHRFPKLIAAGALVFAAGASPAAAASHRYSAQDESWLQAAIQGDRFEVQGGKAAQRKGADQAVKDLGTRLAADHLKAFREARSVAKRLGISRPGEPTESQQWELRVTSEFTGSAFDQHYASLEVGDHKDDIDEAKSEIEGGVNPAILALARQDLKLYRLHLKLSEAAARAVGA